MQSQFHRVTFEEYCEAWAERTRREEDRAEFALPYTPAALTDLAATLHADAIAGRGDAAMKRRAAGCALTMADRLLKAE